MTKLVTKCSMAALAVSLIVVLVAASAAVATTSKKVIYTANGAYGTPNVYAADPDGSHAENLLNESSHDVQPAWSAAAGKIAFTSDRGGGEKIFTMKPNGTEVTGVTESNASYPAWSPDGSKIAYAYFGHLHVINANGSSDHQVGNDTSISHPTWSPDGTKIAYANYEGNPSDINVISASASSSTSSTHLTSSSSPNYYRDEFPSWSPNGNKIVFMSNRLHSTGSSIYIMNVNGTGLTELTTSAGDYYPEWAPGGGVVYFSDSNGLEAIAEDDITHTKTLIAGIGSDKYFAIQQEPLPTVPGTGAHYVALGDSVASGEGINYGWEWEPESKSWSGGETSPIWMSDPYSINNQHCHQSLSAYPTLLRLHLEITGEDFSDFACSGASAANGVLESQTFDDSTATTEPQLGSTKPGYENANVDYDNAEPDVVTLTLGANDIHFADFMNACYEFSVPIVECDTSGANSEVSGYLASEQSELETVLTEIQNRGVEDGHIPLAIVTTYYNPFPSSYSAGCRDLAVAGYEGAGWDLTGPEMSWIRSNLNKLNQNIIKVASMFSNVAIVPLEDVMEGHGFCSVEPWIYGASLRLTLSPYPHNNENPASFHPTEVGQEKIAERIEIATG